MMGGRGYLFISFLVDGNAALGPKGNRAQQEKAGSRPSWARDKGAVKLHRAQLNKRLQTDLWRSRMTTLKQDKPHRCTEEAGLSPGVPHHRLCSQPCSRRLRLVSWCSHTRCPNQRVASSSHGSSSRRNLFSRVLRTDQGFIWFLFHPGCLLIPFWDPMLSFCSALRPYLTQQGRDKALRHYSGWLQVCSHLQ